MNRKHDWDLISKLYMDGTSLEDIRLLAKTHPTVGYLRVILSRNGLMGLNTSKKDWKVREPVTLMLPDIAEEDMQPRALDLLRKAQLAMEEEALERLRGRYWKGPLDL